MPFAPEKGKHWKKALLAHHKPILDHKVTLTPKRGNRVGTPALVIQLATSLLGEGRPGGRFPAESDRKANLGGASYTVNEIFFGLSPSRYLSRKQLFAVMTSLATVWHPWYEKWESRPARHQPAPLKEHRLLKAVFSHEPNSTAQGPMGGSWRRRDHFAEVVGVPGRSDQRICKILVCPGNGAAPFGSD